MTVLISLSVIFLSLGLVHAYYSRQFKLNNNLNLLELRKLVDEATEREKLLRRMRGIFMRRNPEDTVENWIDTQLRNEPTAVAQTMAGWLAREKHKQALIEMEIRKRKAEELAQELAERAKARKEIDAKKAVEAMLTRTPAEKAQIEAMKEKANKLRKEAEELMEKRRIAQAQAAIEAINGMKKKPDPPLVPPEQLKVTVRDEVIDKNTALDILEQARIDAIKYRDFEKASDLRDQLDRISKKGNMSLPGVGLSVRASNCLESENINTVRDLVSHTEDQLLEIRNFDEATLNEVKQKLTELGLRLGMQIPETKRAEIIAKLKADMTGEMWVKEKKE